MGAEAPVVPVGAKIPAAWAWHRLDSICEGIFDCPHSTPSLTDIGPFVVRTQDVRTGIFRTDQAARVSEETYRERIARAEPRAGDLLFSREGTYFGHAAEVPDGVRVCLGQRMVLIRPNSRTIDPTFLRFWINSPFMAGHVAGFRDGSVAERLNLPTIRALPVGAPPLAEQRAIARILGTLDDKIELNRKMNATLEAMARALFKSWFVDFDPVRAKAEGRTPSGMDAETAKVFPSEFVESELGDIPKGWSVASIGDLAEIVGGSTPSTKEPGYWDEGVHHWATPKDLSALATPVIATTERKITDEGLRQISSGLLPVGTVLLSSRAPIGYLGIAEVPLAVNQGFIAMKPRARVPSQFLLRWAEAAHDEIVSRANGSTFLEISKSNFRPIPLVRPSDSALAAYDKLADGFYRQVVVNERNSRSLARLRDELLPCLLSGELSVAGADREVEAVA